mmetsp:Transcript_117957/g.334501  ORF Transcript_117957/g.334501 Transcript_117957/m.334501 type:complete len:334 (+) Transcript_117957:95-1096(+)
MAGGGEVFIGICLGVFASTCGTAGKQLLRFSELQRKRGALAASRVTMATGLAFNALIGPFVDMGSYAFAPQSLIAPLGGLDVIWNTLTAPCTLHEELTPLLVLGCSFIATGATVTSVVGSHHEDDFTVEFIEDTFFRPVVGAYLLVFAAWLAFNILVLVPRSAAPRGEPWARGDLLRGLSLGMVAGSLAGNMFFMKALVALVRTSIVTGSAESWAHWLPYLLLVGASFFALSNVYFLTKTMREYECLFMGAVFEGSLILSGSISGCVVFSEMSALPAWRIGAYFGGLSGIVAGLFVVVRGVKAQKIAAGEDLAASTDSPLRPTRGVVVIIGKS